MSTALTKTERKVMLMRADGFSTKQIAGSMDVSRRTVEVHIYNAYKKIGVKDVVGLIKYVNENMKD